MMTTISKSVTSSLSSSVSFSASTVTKIDAVHIAIGKFILILFCFLFIELKLNINKIMN